ncbi:malectin domain-containing carbohydrate-binding protein [Pontibacter liquoris]|uniref:malectin domain-containing carbohydrate-binding protein n=1 Tax=Pontibacter liquoris TaxID=2905677 RepID=UPI001FA76957|nr:malectin domain-containing carbohydrate-binding protein [Pontibacter liquoris]
MQNIYKSFLLLLFVIGTVLPLSAQQKIPLGTTAEVAGTFKAIAAAKAKAGVNGLKTTSKSNMVRQSVPGQDSLVLNLKVSKREGQKDIYIGEVANKKNSTFFVKVAGAELSGYIILKDQKKAYQYTSTAAGAAYLQQVDIDKVLCIEYFEGPVANGAATQQTTSSATATTSVTALQSLPGAPAVVLLDFDGQTVSGTYWDNGNTINAAPANLTTAEMQQVWEMVSEDFKPFAVNITTSETVYQSAPIAQRMRIIFTPTNYFYPNAGGVSYVGSFNWGDDTPGWVFNSGAKFAGEAGSHEAGHTLGLSHDGRTSPSEAYYYGQNSWAPIMGAGYNVSQVQWSKGEYAYANNLEDDMDVITTENGFGYRPDDHANTSSNATSLKADEAGNVLASANGGIITTGSDVDVFTFQTNGGAVNLTVNPTETYANLDVLLTLKNSANETLVTADPSSVSATVNQTLPAGTYYLYIKGAKGAMGASSNYGSVGQYTISGTLPAAAAVASTIRITSGGTQFTDSQSHTWSADANYSGGTTSSKSFDVAGTSDDALYLKYRYASAGALFSYKIPVSTGTYRVKLHFLEPYFGAPGGKTSGNAGARVFHVDVEGKRVLSNYDIYSQDGAGKAVVKIFDNVSVSDGTLTIAFTSVNENAIVSAIEVEKMPAATQYTLAVSTTGSGAVTRSPDQASYAEGTSISLTAKPASGYQFAGWSGDVTGTANPLTVTMTGNKAITANFKQITTSTTSIVRISAGGAQYTDSQSHTWSADANYSGGLSASKSFDVAGTTEDALYLKYRYASSGAPFSYNIALGAGTYRVKLHFLEPYFGAPGGKTSGNAGARVFHVDVEGKRVLNNYDIYSQDGAGKAVVKTFDNIAVSDGTLNIAFTSVANNAIISAIEIEKITTSGTVATAAEMPGTHIASELAQVEAYPNPFTESIRVRFGLQQPQSVDVKVFDLQGREVATLYQGQAAAQEYESEWKPAPGLASGIYLIRLHTTDKTSYKKVILNR